jgi:hypothetical protein
MLVMEAIVTFVRLDRVGDIYFGFFFMDIAALAGLSLILIFIGLLDFDTSLEFTKVVYIC